MDFTPAQVARQTFPMVSHGFDPQTVGPYLESLAERLHTLESELSQRDDFLVRLQAELAEASRRQEDLTLKMNVATEERSALLAVARQEAGKMIRTARAEAERIGSSTAEILERAETEAAELRAAATDEATAVVQDARREALRLIEESRRAATDLAEASDQEEKAIRERIEELRSRLDAVEGPLRQLAATATQDLEQLRAILPDAPAAPAVRRRLEGRSSRKAEDFDVVHRPGEAVAVSVGTTTFTVAQLDQMDEAATQLGGEESVAPVVEEVQRAILGVTSKVASTKDRRRYLDALRQIN